MVKKIIVWDKNIKNLESIATVMTAAGIDIETIECDISDRNLILNLIRKG